MPRKQKASKACDGAAAVETSTARPAEAAESQPRAGNGAAGEAERTFTAPSGKHYVIVRDGYPHELPAELQGEVVTASEGDLLELLMLHHDIGYGRRFKERQGAVNEGVFHLDWVNGVRLVLEDGKRRPVEVDIRGPDFDFQLPKGNDTASKLRIKRYRKKIDDALKLWAKLSDAPSTLASQEAKAAEAAAELERADAHEKARKAKLKQQQEQQLQEKQEQQQKKKEVAKQPEEEEPKRQQRTPCSEAAWQAQWEQQAAHLESVLSASSSGVEDTDGGRHRRPTVQKKITTRKFTRYLLQAKRSGELHAIAEEWERAHTEMASKASDLSALNEKVKRSLLDAPQAGDLERIAEEMACEAERKAVEVKELKERVFRAMMPMKRSCDLEGTTSDMDDAQKELEMKALQLKHLMKRAWKGMVESKQQRELERIAGEMSEQFQTKAESLKNKIRKGLLRAHRAGQLQEMRDEFDELADSVPLPQGGLIDDPNVANDPDAVATPSTPPPRKRWTEYSSDSDTWDSMEALGARWAVSAAGNEQQQVSGGAPATAVARSCKQRSVLSAVEADVSGSDADSSSAGLFSPGKS